MRRGQCQQGRSIHWQAALKVTTDARWASWGECMAAAAAIGFDREELYAKGFTVVRGVVGPEACARARALIDDYLGPCGASVEAHVEARGWSIAKQYNDNPRVKPGVDSSDFWATAPPFLQSNNYRHDIRHPIRDPVVAGLITAPQVAVHAEALRCKQLSDLKLMQQFLIRTDYQPGPYAPHPGWHMDHATLPWQRACTPSQHYYSSMVALDDVPSGCAPFLVAQGSLERLNASAERLEREESQWCDSLLDPEFHTELRDRLRAELTAGTAPAAETPIEVLLQAGDMAVIDPMALHAASQVRLPGRSRYVCINTFFDASASGHVCRPVRGSTEPSQK